MGAVKEFQLETGHHLFVLDFRIDKVKIDEIIDLAKGMIRSDAFVEVNVVIEKLALKGRLVSHHSKFLL